jgi:hypothetical protein
VSVPSARSSKPAVRKAAGRPDRPVVTFDHLRAKQPIRIPHWVPMDDGASADALNEARQEVARAALLNDPKLQEEAKARVERAEAELRANSVRMLFQGLGRYTFEKLVAEHPPTEEQREEVRRASGGQQVLEYNYETIAAPLIAATCIEPRMTVEQVELLQYGHTTDDEGNELDYSDPEYVAPWNQAEFAGLFQAALRSCTTRRDADLGF